MLLSKFGYDARLRERGTLMPQEVARLRQAIRDHLKDVLKEIDDLVIKLLGESVKVVSKAQSQASELRKSSKSRGVTSLVTLDKWFKPPKDE